MERKTFAEEEVVIRVPRGTAQHVRIEEADTPESRAEIVVRVSKKRRATELPVLGVMVK